MVAMQWQKLAKRFGLRFVISLVVLGGLYLLVFGWPASHKQPNTPQAKISRLRGALDQTYLDSSIIAGFHENDAASYSALNSLLGQFQTDIKTLQTDLSKAPSQVSTSQRNNIKATIDEEDQAIKAFSARFNILLRPIAYDPSTDLGKLDPAKDTAELQKRAQAAQAGLQKAANDTTNTNSTNTLDVGTVDSNTSLVGPATKQKLEASADCFGKLADQLGKKQFSDASSTRTSCIKAYPTTRQQAIANVLAGTFPDSYKSYLKKTVPALLKQFDTQIKNLNTAQTQSK